MAKGVPEDKIEVVYNWVDQNAVVHVERSENKLIGKYNIDPTKFYIEYSGNIGLTQNMDMLLDVMKDLKTSYPEIGLILVPGIEFDRAGFRLGQGGGYYDSFLPETRGFRLGVCHSWELLPGIPKEPHDARVDAVLTERGILRI